MSFPTIGMRLHGGMAPRRCIDLATLADECGLASVWFAENPFQRGVLPAMTGALLATKRLKVGIGVFNPYNRHPTLMAMEMGALDELSGGRAVLGIGSGIGDRVVRMGLSYGKPLTAVRDAVEIVRAMMRGDSVTYEGKVFSAVNAALEFEPPRRDYPIYVAAMGDQVLRMAGEISDGVMISNMCPPGFTSRAARIMAEGAAKANRASPATIVQYVPCALSANRAEARGFAKATVGDMLAAYWRMGEKWPLTRDAMMRESGLPEADFTAIIDRLIAGGSPQEVLDDAFLDLYAISGNAEDFMAGVARFSAVGVTDLILTFLGPRPQEAIAFVGETLKGAA